MIGDSEYTTKIKKVSFLTLDSVYDTLLVKSVIVMVVGAGRYKMTCHDKS
jgi:hypothetical protein